MSVDATFSELIAASVSCWSRRFVGPFDSAIVGADSRFVMTGVARSDGARRGAETLAESTRKMCVIAKAAGVGNIAERLTCLHQRAAFDQMRRMIQAE